MLEGEEAVFRLPLRRGAQSGADDLRVDLEAQISAGAQADLEAAERVVTLPTQALFVAPGGAEAIVRLKPDAAWASPEERRAGELRRLLTVTVSYRDGRRSVRQAAAREFGIRLNSEKIMRRVGNLGNILGLTPKGMR